MKLLLDQDVYALTAQFLAGSGHDLELARQLGLSQASDADLLVAAQQRARILVTRDRDFGNLVFVRQLRTGVIYLRVRPGTINAVHAELARVLSLYSQDKLLASFVVVEPGQHRIRPLDI